MTIAEPMTMLTDYALAGISGYLGFRLVRVRVTEVARLWWAMALIALALGALLGGIYQAPGGDA
jgi:uncharacterized membrane protein